MAPFFVLQLNLWMFLLSNDKYHEKRVLVMLFLNKLNSYEYQEKHCREQIRVYF